LALEGDFSSFSFFIIIVFYSLSLSLSLSLSPSLPLNLALCRAVERQLFLSFALSMMVDLYSLWKVMHNGGAGGGDEDIKFYSQKLFAQKLKRLGLE
jgi:hypothetical protein